MPQGTDVANVTPFLAQGKDLGGREPDPISLWWLTGLAQIQLVIAKCWRLKGLLFDSLLAGPESEDRN